MNIRDTLRLLAEETIHFGLFKLFEANWDLAYKHGYRSWYNYNDDVFVNVSGGKDHVGMVLDNPDMFNFPRFENIGDITASDIKDFMFSSGWIRIAGSDRNNPDKYIVFEGDNLNEIHRLLRRFYHDMSGEIKVSAIEIKENGSNSGIEYAFQNTEMIKAFVMKKELPNGHQYHYEADGSYMRS